MTSEFLSKYAMQQRVIKCCNDYPEAVAKNAAFQTDKIALETQLVEVERLKRALTVENAFATIKQNIKTEMISVGMDVCTNLQGYGIVMKDETIKSLSKHSKSSLGGGKEDEMLTRCQNISEKANSLAPELKAKRGMQDTLLPRFDDLIAQYRVAKADPRGALQEKSSLLTELNAAAAEADLLLTLLASSSVNLKGIADDFLLRLEQASTVFAPRTASTKIKFDVRHAETGKKITGYGVESNDLKMSRTMVGAKAGAMSTTNHKSAGFTITKEGFEPTVVDKKHIRKGKTNIIKTQMTPIKEA